MRGCDALGTPNADLLPLNLVASLSYTERGGKKFITVVVVVIFAVYFYSNTMSDEFWLN